MSRHGLLLHTNLKHGAVLQRILLGQKLAVGAAELESVTLNDRGDVRVISSGKNA